MSPSGLFQAPCELPRAAIGFLAACFKHASSLLHAPSKLPLSFFGACFELVLGILPIEKLKTLEPLHFALHACVLRCMQDFQNLQALKPLGLALHTKLLQAQSFKPLYLAMH